MKKMITLFVAVALIALSSCSKSVGKIEDTKKADSLTIVVDTCVVKTDTIKIDSCKKIKAPVAKK